jgi:hypothetical protein
MKINNILLFLILSFSAQVSWGLSSNIIIRDITEEKTYRLTGDPGFDGRDGVNGIDLLCADANMRDGHNGADGANGEIGDKGGDVYIFNPDLAKLSKLILFQDGGNGGHGGLAGEPSNGCFGGKPGIRGNAGATGDSGKYGNVYILPSEFTIPEVNSTRLITLKELALAPINLSVNTWKKNYGLRQLLAPDSKTKNTYFTFDETKSYKIRLVWNALVPFVDFSPTKLAVTIAKNRLEIKTYTGGLLQYSIIKNDDGYDILVHKVLQEYQVRNLKLKKVKYSGQDLTLTIQEKYRPNISIKTKFVISINLIESNKETRGLGFYEVPKSLVSTRDHGYIIDIGKLRMPEEFKALGAKIKIQLTVYREVRGQVRVQGLEGVFKI